MACIRLAGPTTRGVAPVSQPTGNGENTHRLADGNAIAMLGLGVWQVENKQECVDAVRWALEAGYRHIDTAQAYGNEESVGVGIREAAFTARRSSSRPSSFRVDVIPSSSSKGASSARPCVCASLGGGRQAVRPPVLRLKPCGEGGWGRGGAPPREPPTKPAESRSHS